MFQVVSLFIIAWIRIFFTDFFFQEISFGIPFEIALKYSSRDSFWNSSVDYFENTYTDSSSDVFDLSLRDYFRNSLKYSFRGSLGISFWAILGIPKKKH